MLKGSQDGGIWGAKTEQTRIKIDVKNEDEKEALQDRLGAVLGRSWDVLGPVLEPKKRRKRWKM